MEKLRPLIHPSPTVKNTRSDGVIEADAKPPTLGDLGITSNQYCVTCSVLRPRSSTLNRGMRNYSTPSIRKPAHGGLVGEELQVQMVVVLAPACLHRSHHPTEPARIISSVLASRPRRIASPMP